MVESMENQSPMEVAYGRDRVKDGWYEATFFDPIQDSLGTSGRHVLEVRTLKPGDSEVAEGLQDPISHKSFREGDQVARVMTADGEGYNSYTLDSLKFVNSDSLELVPAVPSA